MKAEAAGPRRRGGAALLEGGHAEAYLSMLGGAFAFAAMGALAHLAGARCGWQVVAFARTSVAFLCSLLIAVAAGVRLVFLRPALLWVRSLAGSVGIFCAFYALTHLPVATAVTLSNTFPVWVTLLAWPVLGYRPGAAIWLAVLAGLAGVLLIQRPYWSGERWAVLAALGNAFTTSVSMIGLNRLSGVDARAIVAHFSGVSAVVCLAVLLASGDGVIYGGGGDATLFTLLAGVGLAGTAGQLGMTRAFALGHPAKVAVVGLTQIAFACAFDLLLWGRKFDASSVCGIILVVAPAAWLLLHSPLRRGAPSAPQSV